ncbi:MAG: response regulator [Spirulina sp. SIO3F2]|nr:response regulator [Spirulina sp. SIO3F2]
MAVRGASILVVDDTTVNQVLLRALLEKEGFQVEVADSASEAIAHVIKRAPDLVLLDVMMPEVNGFEACRQLQKLPTMRDVPIIFITALDDRQSKIKGLQTGAVDYITKPFARDEVLARINVHLNLRTARLQLLQEDKMAALGQLVAGLAHEINNPISFIHGNLQHTQDYTHNLMALIDAYGAAYPEPPESVRQCAEDIDLAFLREDLPQMMQSMTAGTKRIRDIVRALRLFARLEEADCKAIDLHESLESCLLFLNHRLVPRKEFPAIEIVRQYDVELPQVTCYAGALNQALMNVIVNAIDALEDKIQEGGELNFQPNLKITTHSISDSSVEISIADNGIGMSETVRSRVFEQFYTTKIMGRGAGLGLSVAQQIIEEQHKGKLLCSSTLGQGSEFQIQLPLTQTSV